MAAPGESETFTLDAMLMHRDSAEHSHDEAEASQLIARFSGYADAFVAHVPQSRAEAFQSVLLARYLSFLPQVDAAVAGAIREPLEAALTDLSRDTAAADTVDKLFQALSLAQEAAARGKWVESERDMPFMTVMNNVLVWARRTLMA